MDYKTNIILNIYFRMLEGKEHITVNSFMSLDFLAASYKKGMPKSRFPTRTGSTKMFILFIVQSQLFPCKDTDHRQVAVSYLDNVELKWIEQPLF